MVETFTKERTKICEDLMNPEARALLDLPLNEKVAKSQEIIKEAIRKYPKIGLGFSGGTDSLVLLHLTLPIMKEIPIIFVHTRQEFPLMETFMEEVKKEWDLQNFEEVKAEKDRLHEFIEKYGLKTPEFTTECCNYHKISPMMKVIEERGFEAFFVGLRGVEHEERAKETFYSPRKTHVRVHPLLFWRQEDVLDYVKQNNIKTNPLYSKGFTSLGCTICTDRNTDPNAHERAGRGEVREQIMQHLRELGYT